MKPIKLSIRLTAKELWQFSLYHANKGVMGIFNVLFSIAAVFVLAYRWAELTTAYRAMLVVCALMFTVWQPLILYKKSRKQAQQPVVKEPMDFEFDENGFKVTQVGKTLEFTWEQVGRVESISPMIIFYMDRIHAYLIPKTILGEQEEDFRKILREKIAKPKLKRV